MERREVYYSGRVQGVGFRCTVSEVAGRLAVGGFVENLGDGRVRLVAEGEPTSLESLLTETRRRLDRYIEGEQSTTWPASGEFAAFTIRH